MHNTTPFGTHAQSYRDAGFWVRPINGKKPFLENWQMPDDFFPADTFGNWIENYAACNIGIVSGSPFPDGTRLGFFDIDNDLYARLGKTLFKHPQCIRIGSKGLVIPVRYASGLSVPKKIKVKGADGHVAEFLLDGTICAAPPSIHPDTGRPYYWDGQSLLETNFNDLPLIGE